MKQTIYALGYFDGVHLGHAALLKACQALAAEQEKQCGAVTFTGHPDSLLRGKAPGLINSLPDRKMLLRQYGADRVVELAFDKRLMNTSWQDFLQDLTEQYGAAGFVCGSDFLFGRKGQGTATGLQQWCRERNLPCAVVCQQELDGIRISSTHIRSLLEQGRMEEASRFLGHDHCLSGVVSPGKQLGRTIGFPTANLQYPSELVVLPSGVYDSTVTVDGKTYQAVTNVGTRPTVNGKGIIVESHLLKFDGDLYGKTVTVCFRRFLRPEQKFPDLSDLKDQIEKDKNIVEKSK